MTLEDFLTATETRLGRNRGSIFGGSSGGMRRGSGAASMSARASSLDRPAKGGTPPTSPAAHSKPLSLSAPEEGGFDF